MNTFVTGSSLKIFIQVPCLNEEENPARGAAKSIPTQIDGVDEIEILVRRRSSDRTVDVAREHGVTHFVHHTQNMGGARSFRDGVDYALAHARTSW